MLALEQSRAYLEQLTRGSFLISRGGDRTNIMTIGWGSMGYIWNRFVVTIAVRKTRFSHQLLGEGDYFTISVPKKGDFSRELKYCGSSSGRDCDKIEDLALSLEEGTIPVPHLKGTQFSLECRILYKEEINPDRLHGEINLECYPKKDYSVMYYGEILNIIE